MSGTYKVIELVGTSAVSFAEAVKSTVIEASKTVRHKDWFEGVAGHSTARRSSATLTTPTSSGKLNGSANPANSGQEERLLA